MRIYTRRGDKGTTGLLHGGRVAKDDARIEALGAVDEAQAALGLARAEVARGCELDELLVGLARDLWVLMAEVGTGAERRDRLEPGTTATTPAMVERLEALVDDLASRFATPHGFVVPGQGPPAAQLDLARAVVRRAERRVVALALDGSAAPAYLNRLSDLLWTMARWQEGEPLPTRPEPTSAGPSPDPSRR